MGWGEGERERDGGGGTPRRVDDRVTQEMHPTRAYPPPPPLLTSLVNYLVVSGADDGSFRIWDLRSFSSGEPVAKFHWHRGPVTSVEW